ncbi:GntR family transcriptional regulator [Bradyrhizobium centrosematis]|uniref:GntR family transcriptional regulator n=1 Tax=Bradyrhizobium centrosematis TaxID=1300039 RepID=UPI00388E2EAD
MTYVSRKALRICSNIEEAVASRRFRPGEKLPNDVELALEYGVNRHTVRYAIRPLSRTSAPVFVKESLDCTGRVPIKFGENVLCAPRISFRFDFKELSSLEQLPVERARSGKAKARRSTSSGSKG